LVKYATISVPAEVKKALEKAKGPHEWGDFLLDLYREARMLRSKRAFDELASLLTSKDLKLITDSSRDFREKFSLR